MSDRLISRRKMLVGLSAAGGGLALSGCDALNEDPTFNRFLDQFEKLNEGSHRLLTDRLALAREYRPEDRSPVFRVNGTRTVENDSYQRHLAEGFANWRLRVDGLVERPLSISMAQLKGLPQRTQITRHDCVEGWSAIGQWTGPQLGRILDIAGLRDGANYLLFHCADLYGNDPYYETIDLIDAYHPQTIMAWALNGETLPEGNGAPVRLRVERQLGYKHAKFVMRIEAIEDFRRIAGGRGGLWEDRANYEWYAGI